MLKSLDGSQKPKARSSHRLSFYGKKNSLPLLPQGDAFEVRIRRNKISPDLFAKVHKAMRSNVECRAGEEDKIELFQKLRKEDVIKLHALDRNIAIKAYLEGIYVAERYCVLAHPLQVPDKKNAERVMAQYLEYIKHHRRDFDFHEELKWIIKDYQAGTDGEDVRADAALLKRARYFYQRLQALDHREGADSSAKKIEHVIKSDINPLAAFIALRRIFFAV